MDALRAGFSVSEIHELSGIDHWFLEKLENIVLTNTDIRNLRSPTAILLPACEAPKKLGFSDCQNCSRAWGPLQNASASSANITGHPACVKQIDTLAAEYPAQTNYLYLTYGGKTDDIPFDTAGQIFVIGAGPIRIGSIVEFDWCTMNCVWELRRKGYSDHRSQLQSGNRIHGLRHVRQALL